MKKIVSLLVAFTLASAVLTGCGGSQQTPQTAPSPSPEAKKKIIMGTNAGFPPFEYKDGQEIVGIDVEIAKVIAKEMNAELEISDMEFASIIPAVQSGKVDMGIAGMTVNEERLQQVDFSDTYFKASQLVIVKQGSTITEKDLEGKRIGVQDGTTGDSYATETYKTAKISRYSTGMDAVMALTTDKIDAVIIDSYTANALAKRNPGIKVLDKELTSEEYAIAVKKGNKELLDAINKALKKMKEDGSIERFTEQFTKEQ